MIATCVPCWSRFGPGATGNRSTGIAAHIQNGDSDSARVRESGTPRCRAACEGKRGQTPFRGTDPFSEEKGSVPILAFSGRRHRAAPRGLRRARLRRRVLRRRRLGDAAHAAGVEHVAPASVQAHEPIGIDPGVRARGFALLVRPPRDRARAHLLVRQREGVEALRELARALQVARRGGRSRDRVLRPRSCWTQVCGRRRGVSRRRARGSSPQSSGSGTILHRSSVSRTISSADLTIAAKSSADLTIPERPPPENRHFARKALASAP